MTNIIEKYKDKIVELFEKGHTKADAARFISEKTGLGKTQSKYWVKKIYDECVKFGSVDEENEQTEFPFEEDDDNEDGYESPKTLESDLEFKEKYIYNKSEDTYLFLLEKRFGSNIILTGDSVRSIIKSYSNYDGNPATINQVAIRYNIPRNILIYILKVLGHTHDSLPVTNEEFEQNDVEDIKGQIINDKKFALYQQLQKDEWKTIKENSKNWDAFIVGKLNPFLNALDTWCPPKIGTISIQHTNKVSDEKTFLCVLTDTHIGEFTKNSWEGKKYNSEKAVSNILDYLEQIASEISTYKSQPRKCKLVIMGDILNSCVDGMTRKGTKLHNDIVNGDMFKVGLDVIVAFVSTLNQIFETIDISCVNGNHDSFMAGAVYYSASRYFENEEGIIWNISDYWLDSFRVNNCYFIYSHGKDDINHVCLPNSPAKFESFVQTLLLKRVKELVDVESKYFISGHLHSYEHIELNDFEKIRVPSTVTADAFGEGLGYISKARQNCFIVGKNHIEKTLHFYFS